MDTLNVTRHYFHWVDVLRGVASLVILVWHYQHFELSVRESQPFYNLLTVFYDYGSTAVLLFWVISGFVFMHVYMQKESTGFSFAVNRFARLYPLHFATLLLVAGLQIVSMNYTGSYKIYEFNDVYHFFLNILFIPFWGFQEGYSFNAPVWSVSVELFIYAIFWFSLAFIRRFGVWVLLNFIPCFFMLYALGVPGSPFWKCGFFFFAGAVVYRLLHKIEKRKILLTLFFAGASFLIFQSDYQHSLIFAQLFGFMSLVTVFALLDLALPSSYGARFASIGEISYGTYLLHVPIQIFILLMVDFLDFDSSIYTSPFFFFFYFAVVIISAKYVYRYFENPTRMYLRAKLLGNR